MDYEIEFVNDGRAVGWRALRMEEKMIHGELVPMRKVLGRGLTYAYPSGAMSVITADVKSQYWKPVFEITVKEGK